jgi:hypothetical protein
VKKSTTVRFVFIINPNEAERSRTERLNSARAVVKTPISNWLIWSEAQCEIAGEARPGPIRATLLDCFGRSRIVIAKSEATKQSKILGSFGLLRFARNDDVV